jgi:hypothetical protein
MKTHVLFLLLFFLVPSGRAQTPDANYDKALAGSLGANDKNYRGIFILDVRTREEALELIAADPTIKEHILELEIYEWYGSAALPAYLKVHEKIEKQKH